MSIIAYYDLTPTFHPQMNYRCLEVFEHLENKIKNYTTGCVMVLKRI